jgi:hypothetical protein
MLTRVSSSATMARLFSGMLLPWYETYTMTVLVDSLSDSVILELTLIGRPGPHDADAHASLRLCVPLPPAALTGAAPHVPVPIVHVQLNFALVARDLRAPTASP